MASDSNPGMEPFQGVEGFSFSGVHSGIKKTNDLDLGLIVAESLVDVAAVFTQNQVRAAPVEIAEKRVKQRKARAILVNSGNANACTGQEGFVAALTTTEALAKTLGADPDAILPSSTGVIGEHLPVDQIFHAIPKLVEKTKPQGGHRFAQAILTTDRGPKVQETEVTLPTGETIRIVGIAKGAGMIHPNMATTLAFVLTDAKIEHGCLKSSLQNACDKTFNCISVDGDTSTNDAIFIMASAKANKDLIQTGTEGSALFFEGLVHVLQELSQMIVADGEGAERKVCIEVEQAKSIEDAKTISQTVATSLLVKTALHGKDPNWGRIFAAVGRAGIPIEPSSIDLYFDDVCVVQKSTFLGPTAENLARQIMNKETFAIRINLNLGDHKAHCWTCDLGHEYININADYRT